MRAGVNLLKSRNWKSVEITWKSGNQEISWKSRAIRNLVRHNSPCRTPRVYPFLLEREKATLLADGPVAYPGGASGAPAPTLRHHFNIQKLAARMTRLTDYYRQRPSRRPCHLPATDLRVSVKTGVALSRAS